MEQDLQVVLLHKYPEFLKPCCDLLNEEWPRSETARMMSLQASCDLLPTNLVLINKKEVLGHCKLTPIPSLPESCFIEAVVVSKALRGRKLGTFLMKYAEQYAKSFLKLKMTHLSTKGQENFYEKLGYVRCAPVSIYGSATLKNDNFSLLNYVKETPTSVQNIVPKAPPPPPPPPMPKRNLSSDNTVKSNKTFMFKHLE